MSDSQGGRREPATSSRAEEAIIATSTLSDLPSELILHIASLLELEDLLALRKVRFELTRSIFPKLIAPE